MTRGKEIRTITIKELLNERYTVDQIALKTGLSRRTIYRHMEKFQKEAELWFYKLADNGFLSQLKDTMDMLDKSINECYDRLHEVDTNYDKLEEEARKIMDQAAGQKGELHYKTELFNTICKLHADREARKDVLGKMIHDFEIKRGTLLHKVPMAFAIDYAIKKKSIQPEPTPQIKSLDVERIRDDYNRQEEAKNA